MAGTEYLSEIAQPRDRMPVNTMRKPLIRRSTTKHNLLTFDTSQISSNNSGKTQQRHTFGLSLTLVLFKFLDVESHGRQTSVEPDFTPVRCEVLAWVKVHRQFSSEYKV